MSDRITSLSDKPRMGLRVIAPGPGIRRECPHSLPKPTNRSPGQHPCPPDDFCPMAPTLHRQNCTSTFPSKYRSEEKRITKKAEQNLPVAAGPLPILTVPPAALTVGSHYPVLERAL